MRFEKALNWVKKNQSDEGGIRVSSKNTSMYPEVTGYFIPTLIEWGEIDLAKQFGKALLQVQQSDGSFLDSGATTKCVFDTGQIIRGLLKLSQAKDGQIYEASLEKAVKWISSTVESDGTISAPEVSIWGGAIPFGILLYSLEPALKGAQYLSLKNEEDKIKTAIDKLLADQNLEEFIGVSHFHAYILEALVDLQEIQRVEIAIDSILKITNSKFWVPGKPAKSWVCSTAMFQYAVVCYKLEMKEEGDKLFLAAARLQNSTGGWFGSYGLLDKILSPFGRIFPNLSMYFPRTEIPWTVKYFFDALKLRLKLSFEEEAPIFSDTIAENDGRLIYVLEEIHNANPRNLLDLGCGKGRYSKAIAFEFPQITIHACDLSKNVMQAMPPQISKRIGSLVSAPYNDDEFDFILVIESLEHAVNVQAAIREIDRILRPGGTLIIIDKNIRKLGALKVPDWEQWFNPQELSSDLGVGFYSEIQNNLSYENCQDGLFFGVTAKKLTTSARS